MLERSQKYDKRLARKCMAGPNALYLTEELTDSMHLEPGMLVLDLGCGRALSSVFLAREYGVRVTQPAATLPVRAVGRQPVDVAEHRANRHFVQPVDRGVGAFERTAFVDIRIYGDDLDP